MIKLKKSIIFVILTLFFLGNSILISNINQEENNHSQILTKDRIVKGISKKKLYPVFKRIYAIPYSNTLNCKNKSEIFAEYIYQQGCHDVKLVQVWNNDYSKGHQVVQYNGKIYDPTCGYYALNRSQYITGAKRIGLNGPVFTIDYRHNDSIKLKSFISDT